MLSGRPPYWLVYCLLIVVAAILMTALWPHSETVPVSGSLEKPAETTIELVQSLIALATTLNTTMFAAAAALAIKGKDWTPTWSRFDGIVLLLAFVCGAVSYYGVYAAYAAMLEMVDQGVIGGMSPELQTALAAQYYGTLGGFVLLGLVFTRMLEGR